MDLISCGRFFLVDVISVDLFFQPWTIFPWTFFPWTFFPNTKPDACDEIATVEQQTQSNTTFFKTAM